MSPLLELCTRLAPPRVIEIIMCCFQAPSRRAGASTLETKPTVLFLNFFLYTSKFLFAAHHNSSFVLPFQALNQKQVEREFEMDPLFHQMSAAFGEGGAKG